MLGKLIKHEFVNRGKMVAGIILLTLGTAILECIVGAIHSSVDYDNVSILKFDFLTTIFSITTVTFVVAFIGSVVAIVILSFMDYNTRFFKDQGYLTHTLPVKTSTLLFAKGLTDLIIGAAVVIIYPFILCIAIRDFGIYEEIGGFISEFVLYMLEDSQMGVVVVFFILSLIVGGVVSVWHYYAAYAAGHCYFKKKRSMSVLMYIGIYMAGQTISATLISLLALVPEDEATQVLVISIVSLVANLLMLVACFAITHESITKRLDLE